MAFKCGFDLAANDGSKLGLGRNGNRLSHTLVMPHWDEGLDSARSPTDIGGGSNPMPLVLLAPTEAENTLYLAWQGLQPSLENSKITFRVQRRLFACLRDALCFSDLCRLAQEPLLAMLDRRVEQAQAMAAAAVDGKLRVDLAAEIERHKADTAAGLAPPWDGRTRALLHQRFQSSVKAFFIFARALQDVVHSALLQLRGEKDGPKTSMSKGVTHPEVGTALELFAPGYAAWFQDFRTIRNNIKYGLNTNFASAASRTASYPARTAAGLRRPASVQDLPCSDPRGCRRSAPAERAPSRISHAPNRPSDQRERELATRPRRSRHQPSRTSRPTSGITSSCDCTASTRGTTQRAKSTRSASSQLQACSSPVRMPPKRA
jgi:hypothetical protein